jgi:hypothetical protein
MRILAFKVLQLFEQEVKFAIGYLGVAVDVVLFSAVLGLFSELGDSLGGFAPAEGLRHGLPRRSQGITLFPTSA